MTRKLYAVLAATPLAGAAVAADTAGNDVDDTDDAAGNKRARPSLPFGLQVSSFVDNAKENETGSLGPLVASFITQNDPGNAPDHAGLPS